MIIVHWSLSITVLYLSRIIEMWRLKSVKCIGDSLFCKVKAAQIGNIEEERGRYPRHKWSLVIVRIVVFKWKEWEIEKKELDETLYAKNILILLCSVRNFHENGEIISIKEKKNKQKT